MLSSKKVVDRWKALGWATVLTPEFEIMIHSDIDRCIKDWVEYELDSFKGEIVNRLFGEDFIDADG